MSYSENCNDCPYYQQKHLTEKDKTDRTTPPINLEKNNSTILLVFQAPGVEEWKVGKAIQPVKKKGGTAGRRIESSWKRKNKLRNDFDIINIVQCFPGNAEKRDLKPTSMSISACSFNLEDILRNNNYKKIIAFGNIAQDVIENLITKIEIEVEVIKSKHPTGGLSNNDLDKLW